MLKKQLSIDIVTSLGKDLLAHSKYYFSRTDGNSSSISSELSNYFTQPFLASTSLNEIIKCWDIKQSCQQEIIDSIQTCLKMLIVYENYESIYEKIKEAYQKSKEYLHSTIKEYVKCPAEEDM
jgi:predicted DNA-binding protein YlxM (UPF0122 family)